MKAVRQALLEFDRDGIKKIVQAAVDSGLRPFDIIIDGMAAAMTEVGQLYESGEYFLPQLVMAGATMQDGMSVLSPLLKAEGGAEAISKGKVILGTVKGDLHDIGKNLVKIMLEGARFEVIDLGVDVAPDKFVEAVTTHRARLVAMSALLTTTMRSMKLTMESLQAAGLRDQVKSHDRGRTIEPRVCRPNRRRGVCIDSGGGGLRSGAAPGCRSDPCEGKVVMKTSISPATYKDQKAIQDRNRPGAGFVPPGAGRQTGFAVL